MRVIESKMPVKLGLLLPQPSPTPVEQSFNRCSTTVDFSLAFLATEYPTPRQLTFKALILGLLRNSLFSRTTKPHTRVDLARNEDGCFLKKEEVE